MANTGQVNTNIANDSFFWVYWAQDSQDIANNKTKIYWSCGVTCGHSYYSNAIKMSEVYINGVKVYGGGTYSNFSKGEHRIAYGYLDIPHNADGTKTFSISSFTGWLYANYNYSAGASNHTLTQIPRKATITAAADFTDLDNPSITISNPGEFAMDVWLEPNPNGDHLCVRTGIPNTGSYTWSLSAAERDALRNKCAGTSCPVRIGLYSYVGGTQYADYQDKRYTMVESTATKPTVSMAVSPVNTGLDNNFKGLYIQGKSKVGITVTGGAKYGADISSCYAAMEGKTYHSAEFTSDVIQGSGTVTITGYAKDSRGFTGAGTKDITAIPYSKPMIVPAGGENAILCYRCDSNGNKTGKGTRVYLKAKMVSSKVESGGHQHNFCTLQMRMKAAGDNWSDDWVDLMYDDESETGEYIGLLPGNEAQLTKAYTIQLRAIDNFREHDIKTFDIPTEDVALHLGAGGKNVSVGSYCDYSEPYTFHSEWKGIFDRELILKGQVISNHVVEEGTDGIWKYRKWADGTAECFGIYVQENVEIKTEWGTLFESPGYVVDLPSGLFVETPQFSITLTGSQGSLLETYSEGSATQSPYMCAIRPFAITIPILNTSIVCHGRWKE